MDAIKDGLDNDEEKVFDVLHSDIYSVSYFPVLSFFGFFENENENKLKLFRTFYSAIVVSTLTLFN